MNTPPVEHHTQESTKRTTRVLAAVVAVVVAVAVVGRQRPEGATAAPTAPAVPAVAAPAAPEDKDQAADRDAVVKAAREFEAAFAKGDAKAVAELYTENAELREPGGRSFVGRPAIEKAYAESFKANPGAKVEVLVKSVRFPAKDMAVEEGLLRASRGPKDLPATTSYVVVHARDGGRWRIALSSEAGAGQDRLEDLDWLLGEWTAKVKDDAVKFAFVRDAKKPVVTGTFTRTPAGKAPLSGTVRVSPDPETGQLRSWAFEDDGAHSQALWSCDGKSWVLDVRGVLADGTPVAERIVLQRVAPDAITWRSIDRVADGEALPDAPPLRLTRVAAPK